MLRVTVGELIQQEVLKNLLSAQKRIAETGSASEVVRISKYLFRLAEKFKDPFVDSVPEDKQRWSSKPV